MSEARTRMLGRSVSLTVIVLVLAFGVAGGQGLDPRLGALEPLVNREWRGLLGAPDGSAVWETTFRVEPWMDGRAVRITHATPEIGDLEEGYLYWDDPAGGIAFFTLHSNGVFTRGVVVADENVITFEGTLTWPSPPPDPGIKQAYQFRNTLELLSGTTLRDSWFQNASGPWQQGHVVELTAREPGDDRVATEAVDLHFSSPPTSGSDRERTLGSVVRVRDIGEEYATGGLYLIDQVGDRQELFEQENRDLREHPWITQPWRFCSVFSAKTDGAMVVGRNWDNQNVGSVVVSRYRPADGYASVSLSRAIDLGFPLNLRLDEIAATPLGERLLLAPFFAYDGINEKGLVAAVTGVGQVTVRPRKGADQVFVGYLVRRILDRCRTVDEAIRLVEGVVPFDLDASSLNSHFFVADASGRSVVLEYAEDSWRIVRPAGSWQVLTNRPVDGVSDRDLREQCWRYATLSKALEGSDGGLDWVRGMRLLSSVAQSGTTWSVVYLPGGTEVYLAVYQDWDRVYRIHFPEPAGQP